MGRISLLLQPTPAVSRGPGEDMGRPNSEPQAMEDLDFQITEGLGEFHHAR